MSETQSAVVEQPAATETTQPAGDAKATADAAAAATKATEEVAKTETKVEDKTETLKAGPPDQYALVVPVEDLVSAEGLKDFEGEARVLGLTQAQAQAHLERRIDAFIAQSDADIAELTAHPVYGGANLPQTQKYAEAALNRFAPKGTPIGDAARTLLRTSGRGNAVAIVAIWTEIGKAMAEDRPVAGGEGRGTTERKSNSEVFYGAKDSAAP